MSSFAGVTGAAEFPGLVVVGSTAASLTGVFGGTEVSAVGAATTPSVTTGAS